MTIERELSIQTKELGKVEYRFKLLLKIMQKMLDSKGKEFDKWDEFYDFVENQS